MGYRIGCVVGAAIVSRDVLGIVGAFDTVTFDINWHLYATVATDNVGSFGQSSI